jgi:hypothetical protein
MGLHGLLQGQLYLNRFSSTKKRVAKVDRKLKKKTVSFIDP